jgi:hypothetical protein
MNFDELSECCEAPMAWIVCESKRCSIFHQTAVCEVCGEMQKKYLNEAVCEVVKMKDYSLHTWADGFGIWSCRVEFIGKGLGNTGEAERVANNGIRAAKRRIRAEIAERMYDKPKRLSYFVSANESTLGSGQLKSITITEK